MKLCLVHINSMWPQMETTFIRLNRPFVSTNAIPDGMVTMSSIGMLRIPADKLPVSSTRTAEKRFSVETN
jgi:hypothetical protein